MRRLRDDDALRRAPRRGGARRAPKPVRRACGRRADRAALPRVSRRGATVSRTLRVAVVARSVFPLHGLGGLERSVYDLVRYLARARRRGHADHRARPSTHGRRPAAIDPRIDACAFVPYRTFPLAGRRGTTVLDRSTAYPLFGERAGRVALGARRAGRRSISSTASAPACSATRAGARRRARRSC